MTLKQTPAPYQRKRKTTLQIMVELTIALSIVWLAAVVTTFIKLGAHYGIQSILLMVVSIVVTLVCDVLVTVLRNKKDKELGGKIIHDITHGYSWVTAMIFTLCCPVWTNYYVIIVGSIFATLIGKLIFGGFGKNIFNPAAIGRIFVAICFDLSVPAGIVEKVTNPAEGVAALGGFDLATGATVTNSINSSMGWLADKQLASFKIVDLLTGNYFGAMGETFTILILVLGIILVIRKDMNWRAPVFYLGTVALSALAIGLVLGFRNPFLYTFYHLAVGGVVFGAVFMITDPVTTPTSPFGNCLVGILAGLLTVLIRVGTKAPEGVVYSLVVINLATPMIDGLIKGKTTARKGVKYGVTFGSAAVALALTVGMAWNQNGGRTVYDINGIDVEEYNDIKGRLDMKWINDNSYDLKLYDKDAPEGIDKVYYVVDESKNVVGQIYLISVAFEVSVEGYPFPTTGNIIVAFNGATKGVAGVQIESGCATSDGFGNKAKDFYSEYDYSNSVIDATIADGSIGATYSAKGVQKAVKDAAEKYAANNA